MNMWHEISLLPCSFDYQWSRCHIIRPQCLVLALGSSSHALGREGEGATQNPPGMQTGSELLRAAFWAACSNTLRKIQNA